VFLDLLPMIIVVTEGVKNLRKSKMRQIALNLLWRLTELPALDDRADRRAGVFDHWLAAQDRWDALDVGMVGRLPRLSRVHRKEGLTQLPEFSIKRVNPFDYALDIQREFGHIKYLLAHV